MLLDHLLCRFQVQKYFSPVYSHTHNKKKYGCTAYDISIHKFMNPKQVEISSAFPEQSDVLFFHSLAWPPLCLARLARAARAARAVPNR